MEFSERYLRDLGRLGVFDGAIGTQLSSENEAADVRMVDELNLKKPVAVREVHRKYLEAGADFLTTNTFSSNPARMSAHAKQDNLAVDLSQAGAKLAREVVDSSSSSKERQIWVAGSMGPSGESMVPLGSLDFDSAYRSFSKQAEALQSGGVDLIIVETMESLREVKAALLAVKDCGLPVVASLAFSESGSTSYGVSPRAGAVTLDYLGSEVLSANCGTGPANYSSIFESYAEVSHKPMLVEPNAGVPRLEDGESVYEVGANEFYEELKPILNNLALVGSCCGSTPAHTSLLAERCSEYAGYSPSPSLQGNYFCSAREVSPKESNFYELEVDCGRLMSARTELREEGIPLFKLTNIPDPDEGLESQLGRLFSVIPDVPAGFVTSDAEVLSRCLKSYPGVAPVVYTSKSSDAEEVCKRLGGLMVG